MEEILPQRPCGAGCHIVVEKESTELLPRAEDFPAARTAPSAIARRKIKQLESPRQGPVEPIRPLRLPRADGTINFAAHVRYLGFQRQRHPAPRGECLVSRHFSPCTSAATTCLIRFWRSGSSTFRERFPCAGRTLISESNSIHPSPGSAGNKLIPQRFACADPPLITAPSASECSSPPTANTRRSTSTTPFTISPNCASASEERCARVIGARMISMVIAPILRSGVRNGN